jgi:hypothetical protein
MLAHAARRRLLPGYRIRSRQSRLTRHDGEVTDMTELPVACTLSAGELAERRAGLLAELRRHRQEVRWLPDGAAFRYPCGPGVLACLAEFVRLESQC